MADPSLTFSVSGGSILCNSKPIALKGTNWFGLETSNFVPHGIWSVSMDSCLDFLQKNGFNALRVPFSLELALGLDTIQPTGINFAVNPELQGKTTGQVMDALVEGCATRGILVMPDLHRLKAAGGIPELWYGEGYTEADVIAGWLNVVTRYRQQPFVFAADLKNEPHGAATWGNQAPGTDWNKAAERIGDAILAVNPDLLIVVEGIQQGSAGPLTSWWGGDVMWAVQSPVQLKVPNRVVYSPHVYGPSAFQQPYFADATFPDNLPAIWEAQWAGLLGSAPVVIGEWGGWHTKCSDPKDVTWHHAIAAFIASRGISSFYWCLNPNSGDTGGLLADDWMNPVQDKLELLAQACPNPTRFPGSAPVEQVPYGGTDEEPLSSNSGNGWQPSAYEQGLNGGSNQQPAPVEQVVTGSNNGQPPPFEQVSNVSSDGQLTLTVTTANTWTEGTGTRFFQTDVQVTNGGAAAVPSATVVVTPADGITQSWNATQTAAGVFGFPEWLAAQGGLQPGQSFNFGFISSGAAAPAVAFASV